MDCFYCAPFSSRIDCYKSVLTSRSSTIDFAAHFWIIIRRILGFIKLFSDSSNAYSFPWINRSSNRSSCSLEASVLSSCKTKFCVLEAGNKTFYPAVIDIMIDISYTCFYSISCYVTHKLKRSYPALEMPWSLAEQNHANRKNATISSAELPRLILRLELKCLSEDSRQWIHFTKVYNNDVISEASNLFHFVFIAITDRNTVSTPPLPTPAMGRDHQSAHCMRDLRVSLP